MEGLGLSTGDHMLEQATLGIEVDERLSLIMIDLQPLMNSFGCIILTLDQLSSAVVADTFHLGRNSIHIVAGTAGFANPATSHTAKNFILGDLDSNNSINFDTMRPFEFRLLEEKL